MDIPGYGQFEETIPLEEYARGRPWSPGEYSQDIEVGEIEGETYFIKDEDKGKGLLMPYVLATTVSEELGIELEMDHDPEAGKIIRPEIDGAPTDEYIPGISGFLNKLAGRPIGPEPGEIYNASALKYFIADPDVAPNIVVDGEDAEPIDFQRAGATAEHFYTEFLSDLEEVFHHLNREFSRTQFEKTVQKYAEQADLESLEEDLNEGLEMNDVLRSGRRRDSVVEMTIENFERFR